MMDKQTNWTKLSALGLGGLLGLSHISMIVMLATRETSKYPKITIPPVNEYSSVRVMAGEDGYSLEYRGNDPKSMFTTKTVNKGGFLKKGDTTTITKEYTMDGAVHHGGPVSNNRTWIDPAGVGSFSEKKTSAKTEECIEARGGGKSTGRLVGGSVGAAAGSGLSSIPFVGWVLAGAATMIGMNEGADLGGDVAESFSDACIEEI
tara:strand:+ start:32 stop:646 length:615 start_codon:yes stop_codon:yes gene_type:complete